MIKKIRLQVEEGRYRPKENSNYDSNEFPVYKPSWLRTGIVKKEELAAYDESAVESITEMQLLGDQLEKMELEDELEEIDDAENAREEVVEENKNKEKTFSQPKITTFFNQ